MHQMQGIVPCSLLVIRGGQQHPLLISKLKVNSISDSAPRYSCKNNIIIIV
jgi:hypothetical protein